MGLRLKAERKLQFSIDEDGPVWGCVALALVRECERRGARPRKRAVELRPNGTAKVRAVWTGSAAKVAADLWERAQSELAVLEDGLLAAEAELASVVWAALTSHGRRYYLRRAGVRGLTYRARFKTAARWAARAGVDLAALLLEH
jgi:hypothetical protein